MPLQDLNLNEYGIESGGKWGYCAAGANFCVFRSLKCQNLLSFHPFPIYQAPGATFVWCFFLGGNDMLAPLLGFLGAMAGLPPPLDPPVALRRILPYASLTSCSSKESFYSSKVAISSPRHCGRKRPRGWPMTILEFRLHLGVC